MSASARFAAELDDLIRAGRARPLLAASRELSALEWRDQADAAAAQLAGAWRCVAAGDAPPGTRCTSGVFATYPSWVTLSILTKITAWTAGELRTCIHQPTAERPQPVHAAAWAPRLVVCSRCTHLLELPRDAEENARCDACGRVTAGPDGDDPIRAVVIVAGLLAWACGVCRDCTWRPR